MKKTFYALTMVLALVVSLASCSKDADGYSDEVNLGSNKLTVRTKAAPAGTSTMTVATPINIYVFDNSGKCIALKTIESETETADMKLQAGDYKLYAIAGASASDYTLPSKDEATPQSIVALKTDKQHSDIMAASSNVVLVDGEDADVTLLMQRKVLLLTSVNISDVPDDVTSISASLSPLHGNVTLAGDYSDEQVAQTVTLSKQSDGTTWTADCNLFLLPSIGNPSITFTFRTTDGKTKTFTYASQKPLVANYKVSINVNYLKVKEPTMKCVINGVEWAGTDVWSFDADERDFTVDGGDDKGGTTVDDSSAPAVGTLYKGCYVLKTEKSGNVTVVTLVAPEQYNTWKYKEGDQTSMKAEIDEKLKEIKIDGIQNWRLPYKAELEYIKDNYDAVSDALDKLEKRLFLLGSPIYNSFLFKDVSGNIYSYILKTGTIIDKPGKGTSVILNPFTTINFPEKQ